MWKPTGPSTRIARQSPASSRQRVSPKDLLNRWIVPLEKRVDYLTLHTGKKVEIPFDMLIVFSTNLDPADLVGALAQTAAGGEGSTDQTTGGSRKLDHRRDLL